MLLSVGSEVMELIWGCSFLWNEGRGTSKKPGGSVSIYCSGLGTGLKNQARGATKRGAYARHRKSEAGQPLRRQGRAKHVSLSDRVSDEATDENKAEGGCPTGLACPKTWVRSSALPKLGVVALVCNTRTT